MSSKIRSIQRAQNQQAAKEATIQVSLAELVNSQSALQSLAGQVMPAPVAFKLSKIIKAVNSELKTCDETRLKLCEQYGTLNEKTNQFEFPSKTKRESLENEYAELVKTEVTIQGERLSLDRLSNLSISAGDILALSWLIEGE